MTLVVLRFLICTCSPAIHFQKLTSSSHAACQIWSIHYAELQSILDYTKSNLPTVISGENVLPIMIIDRRTSQSQNAQQKARYIVRGWGIPLLPPVPQTPNKRAEVNAKWETSDGDAQFHVSFMSCVR